MIKPEGYDSTPAIDNNILPVGNYTMIIINAKETYSSNGRRMLLLFLDVASGTYAKYYDKLSQRIGASIYLNHFQAVDGNSIPHFKAMITSIERSNPGYIWNWNEATLVGKLVGAQVIHSEYVRNEEKRITPKVKRFYSLTHEVPEQSCAEQQPVVENDLPF